MSQLRAQLEQALGSAYAIERELGGGGMSRLFLATERALGRHVVIKVLPPDLATGVSVERFRREIGLLAARQHPLIVPLFAAGQVGDFLYYTMPFVAGESLRAKLARDGPFSVSDAVRILRDVAEALAFAHRHGVVHRDIKPENILLAQGHAVVTDFGVAKALRGGTGPGPLTTARVALGTPAYMAPEQVAADPRTDHRADLYAFGALAYELLTGHPPFRGASPHAVLAAHVAQPPEPLTRRQPDVPPELAALVMRCLEKDPGDRPQGAEEVVRELEAVLVPSRRTASEGKAPHASRRRLVAWVAAGIVGLGLLGVAVLLVRARGSKRE